MSRYNLTEAYSEIYNPQKVDELFDNLRFIDYMLDEDIQEVVESLFWELRDYGNTIDESFELLSYAASDEVICESYDSLIDDILYEATVTSSKQRSKFAGSARDVVTSGRGDVIAMGRQAQKLGRKTARVVAKRQAAEAEQQAQQRRATRKARVDGAISRVKSAMDGAKGGLGRAAKALGGAAKKSAEVVGGIAQKGKAMLGSLLRRGATAAGKGIYRAGSSIASSGRAAASAPAKTGTATVGGRKVTVTYEPTPEAGSKRRAIGKAVSRVGAAIKRMGSSSSKKGTEGTTLEPSTSDVATRPQGPKAPAAQGPRRPYSDRTVLPQSYNKPITTQKVSGGFDPSKKSSQAKKPTPLSKKGTPLKGAAVAPAVRKARKELGPQRKRVAPGTTGERGVKKERGGATYDALGRRIREEIDYEVLLQYIAEDIIEAGYAYDLNEAYDIIENLNENTLQEIVSEYI